MPEIPLCAQAGRKPVADWTGPTVEVISNPLCGGCQELKAKLTERGVAYADWDVTTVCGLAMSAWYGSPDVLPAVVVDGVLLDEPGDVLELVRGE